MTSSVICCDGQYWHDVYWDLLIKVNHTSKERGPILLIEKPKIETFILLLPTRMNGAFSTHLGSISQFCII